MKRNTLLFLSVFFTLSLAVFGQAAEKTIPLPTPKTRDDSKLRQLAQIAKEKNAEEFTGRLEYHDWGQEKKLVLHGQDGLGYIIAGGMTEKLKDILFQLGENNLVCLKGYKAKGHIVHCRHSYNFDATGDKKEETVCLTYASLEVFGIINQARSDEKLPPIERNSEAEAQARAAHSHEQLASSGGQKGVLSQCKGTIKEISLNSPIKSMLIVADSIPVPGEKITLLLTANTRVAKRLNKDEGMAMDVHALKKRQKVLVIYTRDDFNAEALNVTIIDD